MQALISTPLPIPFQPYHHSHSHSLTSSSGNSFYSHNINSTGTVKYRSPETDLDEFDLERFNVTSNSSEDLEVDLGSFLADWVG